MEQVKTINKFPQGAVHIPPSKSIGHRAIICAALAAGESVIENVVLSDDIQKTISCLISLGVDMSLKEQTLTVRGGIQSPSAALQLDCGESGSTLRFLMALAAAIAGEYSFTGQGRLLNRPLGPYLDALSANGVTVTMREEKLLLRGRLTAGTFQLPGDVSSQYITGLLLALPLLSGDSEIIVTTELQSCAYVDLTLAVQRDFGVIIENEAYKRFKIKGEQSYHPCNYEVEGDFSAAAMFLVAGALGCDVECLGLNSNSLQGDRAILDIIGKCGGQITRGSHGGLKATCAGIKALDIDAGDIPDLVPPLAALLCRADGPSRIYNAGRLRLKESDRLTALATGLSSLGADITAGEDELLIKGVSALHGGEVSSHNDHRIAMALALAAISSTGSVTIHGASSVSKSYPDFWQDFCRTERRADNE